MYISESLFIMRYTLNIVSCPLLVDYVRHIPLKRRRMVTCMWHSLLIGSEAQAGLYLRIYIGYLYDSNNSTLLVPNKLLLYLEGVSCGALSNQFLTVNNI